MREGVAMLEIDGSQGEGGGQILRTALALSLITGRAFRLTNIRAKRPKPGLMRQHLACVQAAVAVGGGPTRCFAHAGAADTAQGLVQGIAQGATQGPVPNTAQDAAPAALHVGAQTLTFVPGPVHSGAYAFDIGSAGSCMLVLQTVLWPLLMAQAPSQLTLRGGTHNPMAPSYSFLKHMAAYFVGGHAGEETCAEADADTNAGAPWLALDIVRHGFYPAGGGEVLARITPPAQGLGAISLLQRGALRAAWAECLHAGVPKHVAERELGVLQEALGWQPEQLRNCALRSNEGPGNALQAILQFEHIAQVITVYGSKGTGAESVARALTVEIRSYLAHIAPVGEHLADQLMLPMALAGLRGLQSQFLATTWSEHARTNAQVIAQFLPVRFDTQSVEGGVLVRLG
jgi:RNA 3'-terminal phosphate cyclase (ATP)